MKVPDKIYLVEDNGELFDEWYIGEFNYVEKNHCYIRKDLLMERLARAKELRERHSSNPNTLREYIAPIVALMDIINSL